MVDWDLYSGLRDGQNWYNGQKTQIRWCGMTDSPKLKDLSGSMILITGLGGLGMLQFTVPQKIVQSSFAEDIADHKTQMQQYKTDEEKDLNGLIEYTTNYTDP